MKFYPLVTTAAGVDSLDADYKCAREIGIIKLGESYLFFRKGLKLYYISYKDITRCFRRVMTVPAQLCCGKGNFEVENLVICAGDTEVAQIQLPGTKAAKKLMEELKIKAPHALFSCSDGTNDSGEDAK